MKLSIFFLACVSVPWVATAQNVRRIDSLRNTLPAQHTEARYKALNDLAWEYRFAYPDSTLTYANQAYLLGQKLNLHKGLAQPLNYQGVASNYKGDRLKAYDFYSRALEVGTQQRDTVQIAHANNNLGRLFFEQGILSKSYDYLIAGYHLFKQIHNLSGEAYSLQSLGTIQRSQKDFIQSEKNYQEAYRIRLQLGNQRDIMAAQSMLGRLYFERNDFLKSEKILLQADSVGNLIHDAVNLAEVKLLLAKTYLELKRTTEAEKVADAGAQVIGHLPQYKHIIPEAMLVLGKIKFELNKLTEAKKYFQSSLQIAIQIKDLHGQMDAFQQLWKLAEYLKNKPEAIVFMNQYLLLKDSIKDLGLTRQVDRLQFQLEIEKKEKENQLLKLSQANQKSVIAQQRSENIALLIGVLCSVVVVATLWYYFKKRNKHNHLLAAQNKFIDLQRKQIEKRNIDLTHQNHRLEELNHEKDMLMNIVAHDLKSPLARIMGLANLIGMESALSQQQQEYVRLMKDVTQSNLNLITDLLDVNALQLQSEAPQLVDFDLAALLTERITFFQHASTLKNIELTLNHNLKHQVLSNPGYLTRIIDNLVSNAIKFSGRGTQIQVTGMLTDGVFNLSVKDNGPGFSASDKNLLYQRFKKLSARPTAGETSNGLGLAIVKTLVDRLEGEISLATEEGNGSEFTVRIPVKVVEQVIVN